MADSKSYTVEAILKATDSNFTKTMRGAMAAINALKGGANGTSGAFKSMFGANLASSALISGLGAAKRGITSMVSELNSSNLAWKSFEGNMKILGQSDQEIAKAKASMQDYATKTIYSASDMASTYAQLAAVGVKNTGQLVKGFGGLAAAAENPKQAMKTLSQQATQMAAKPMVQWADFKLMLEQTPSGIAAVAKEMGMSTEEMVTAVQDGKIKTEDFFNAIEKVGTSTSFTKMATEFKSVGQAIDGMKEGISNKLQPAFEKINQFGIKVFEDLAGRIDKINFGKLADGIGSALGNINITGIFDTIEGAITKVITSVQKFWESFKDTGATTALTNAFSHIKDAFEHVKTSLGGNKNLFQDLGKAVGEVVKWVSQAATGISNFISNMKPSTIKTTAAALSMVVVAFKGLSALAGLNPFSVIVGAIVGLVLAFANAYNSSEKFRNGVNKALDILKQWGPVIASVVGGFDIFKMLQGWNPFKSFASKGKSAFDTLTKGFKSGSDSAKQSKSIIGEVFTGIGEIIESFGKSIERIFSGFGKTLEGFGKGFGKAMEGLGNGMSKISPAQWLGISVAILAVGAAVLIASYGFERMANAAKTLAQAGTAAQVMFTLMLGGLIGLVAVVGAFGAGLSAGAVGMLAFGAAAIMVGVAIAIVASQSAGVSEIIRAIGAAFALVLSVLPPVIAAFANLAVAIGVAIATIVTSVAGGIATIVTAVAGGISQIILAFATGFAIVVTSVAGAIASVVGAFSGLISAIGGVISSIGAVLQGLSAVFSSIFTGIADVITAFGSSVSGILESIGSVFESFGESVKSVFEGAGQVIESFGTSVKTILDGVSGVIDSIGNAALNAGKGVKQMAQGVKMLVDLPFKDLTGTLLATADGLRRIGSSAAGLGTAGSAMQLVSTGIRLIGTASMNATSGMSQLSTRIQTLQSTMMILPSALSTTASSFATFATTASSGMAGLSAVNVPIAALKTQLVGLSQLILQTSSVFIQFGSSASVILPVFSSVAMQITTFNTNLLMLSTTLRVVSTAFLGVTNSVSSLVARILSVATSFQNVATQARLAGTQIIALASTSQVVVSSFSAMASAIRSHFSSISSSVSNGMSRAKSSVQSNMNSMLSIMNSVGSNMVSTMKSVGTRSGQALASGLKSQSGAVSSAVASMIDAAVNRAKAGYGAMSSAGNWIGQGLAAGMRSALGAVTAAANALVEQAERAAQAKARIASPSKLFRDEVGWWIGAGVAVGINKSASLAVDAISDMYSDINTISYQANDLLDTNFSYDISHGHNGSLQIENPSQNNLILGLLDQLNRSLDRDLVVAIDGSEIARTAGADIANYNNNRQKLQSRLRGEVNY